MQKNAFLLIIFFIPTLLFGISISEKQLGMKGRTYPSQLSYFSFEAAFVGERGSGFYEYRGDSGKKLIKSQDLSGSGVSVGIGYTFSKIAHFKLKYKKLTYSYENDYSTVLGNADLRETNFSWSASTNLSGYIHFEVGALMGFGSVDFDEVGSANFFTYGPKVGFSVDITDSIEIFTDVTWQQRSYSEVRGLTFNNYPFGLEMGLRYNFN